MPKASEEQRLDLINAQQRLRAEGRSAVVVVTGVDCIFFGRSGDSVSIPFRVCGITVRCPSSMLLI